ncbi:MAG: hypothetical protein U9R08_07235, partial [Nanoarchaeota archaeon]|nr:hypothetical protein [Nanoarchaeota archaeon]
VDYDDSDCPCDYTFIIWQDLDGDGHGDSTVSREVCVIFGDIFIPEPVPTCADGIEYCLTSGDCIANGYYWYNDICNVVPEPTCADGIEYCLTSGDCIANGYYWYDDICNVVPEPTCADGIEYCLTSGDCITNGYYWYDNDCHTVPEPVPTCADGVVYCLTSGDCIANGYYWYDNDCHAVPEPLICCNPGPSADNRDYDICQGGSIVLGCNSKSTQYDQAAAIANCIASRTKYDSSLPLSTWIYACETNWDYHYCSDITRTGSPVEPYCMVQEAAD